MKNFLAVDTSGNHLAVVVGKGEETFSVYVPDCAMKHSVSVMPAVDEALKKASLALEDCDVFSACVGAGSFTGIRIGISTVKGFCTALKKPALPVTSFSLVAYTKKEEKILVLSDALHGTFYACGYENGKITIEPCYISTDQAKEYIEQGYKPCSLEALEIETEIVSPADGLYNAVATLCARQENFGDLTALYIRKSQAEINLEKGESAV